MKIYCFDLDNTICITKNKKYFDSIPIKNRIKIINKLYEKGHYIKIYTARGMTEFNGNLALILNKYYTKTKNQLDTWGLKYHEFIMGKPSFDLFVDDKAIHSEQFFAKNPSKKGIIIGSFDIIHPGYIEAFKKAKENCDHLTILLHKDPSIDRLEKYKPILSLKERKNILLSIKYIDDIIVYNTEKELLNLLKKLKDKIQFRFVGEDYLNKEFTGKKLIPVYYIPRKHQWSTTKFKKLIYEQVKR